MIEEEKAKDVTLNRRKNFSSGKGKIMLSCSMAENESLSDIEDVVLSLSSIGNGFQVINLKTVDNLTDLYQVINEVADMLRKEGYFDD